MKAFLINPPTGLYVREDRCQSFVGDFVVAVNRPPQDLMLMASSLESAGIICKIRDYPIEKKGWSNFKADLAEFGPDFLIISTTTPSLRQDLESCKIAKEANPHMLTVAKGAHFLVYDLPVLKEFPELDIIIRGENEIAIKEIATENNLATVLGITYRDNGQIKRNADRPFLENLDTLPLPARHLVRNELYIRPDNKQPMAIIETSRGCPGSCIFCLVGPVAGKRIRNRSVKAIIQEIEECVHKYNIRNFHFKSDTFTWNKIWVLELCREISKRDLKIEWICNSRVDTLDTERLELMKNAGCRAIGFGIESGNQEILEKIKKGITLKAAQEAVSLCRKCGVKSYAYFIIGFPWDTKNTVDDSIRFSLKLNPDFIDFFLPFPFPGTELEKVAKELKLLSNDGVKAYASAMMNTLALTKEDLSRLKKKGLRRFYLRPSYILRTLASAGSPGIAWNYFCQGIKTLFKISWFIS